MMGRHTVWALLGLALLAVSLHGQVNADTPPSESECRPYIEKAIHELQGDTVEDKAEETSDTTVSTEQPIDDGGSSDELQADQPDQTDDQTESGEGTEDSGDVEKAEGEIDSSVEGDDASAEAAPEAEASADETENAESGQNDEESGEQADQPAVESGEEEKGDEASTDELEEAEASADETENAESGQADESEEQANEPAAESGEEEKANDGQTSAEDAPEQADDDNDTTEDDGTDTKEDTDDAESGSDDGVDQLSETEGSNEAAEVDSGEKPEGSNEDDAGEQKTDTEEDTKEDETDDQASTEGEPAVEDEIVAETAEESGRVKREISDDDDQDTAEDTTEDTSDDAEKSETDEKESTEAGDKESVEEVENLDAQIDPAAQNGGSAEDEASTEEAPTANDGEATEESGEDAESGEKSHPEEDLLMEFEIPENLRDRDHITELLHLDDVSSTTENAIHKTADVILKELKKIYDSAIKPLEVQYKYRDLSNRHFGDPEIFSKPLVLFMGPWSGGKSTILNYLTDNEYTANSLRTGAEPSPAYFNILMHGDEPEVLDGTQLAADWTFSGLQKFGEGMLDRLRGLRMPNKLLEKVNIVEIPGILEVRKQVSRLFPFNDACQWFIDRADIIFLVYDPAKLDVGPETEAILDQLKGREYQTRIVLNKADTVKPEELMRVQGALIWNISPLMSSAQPPVMYTVSLWSHPFDSNAPVRLLQAQERALLRDLRGAIDKRIENKIASARRFAVRVRNHAKMVDCYLTTYYNHKTLFGNKKQISEQIISNPQNYHIYEGISTLTNISRYDLPDPDVYRDFFRLNPLYEFKKLVETCTYFNGCPINKLDVAIAYDLPELVGKYKKALEANLAAVEANEAGAKPKS